MWAFLSSWGRALVSGDSVLGTVTKIVAITLFLAGAVVLPQPILLYLRFPGASVGDFYTLPIGWTSLAPVALFYRPAKASDGHPRGGESNNTRFFVCWSRISVTGF